MLSCVKPGMAAFRYGDLARNSKSWDEALIQYDKSIALDAAYAPAYYSRGLVYYHKLEYTNAIADYSKAIELDNKEETYYYSRGKAYALIKDYPKAIADFTSAIKLDPEIRRWLLRTRQCLLRYG